MHKLILLHGALGNAETMSSLASALKDEFDIHVPDLPGHGTMSMHDSSPTVESLAHFLNGYINEHALISPVIFGYSLGGYVALYHELLFPKLTKQVITFATKFHWNASEAEKQVKMLNPDVIESKVPAFAQVLKERHGEAHWRSVLSRTADMMQRLGQKPLLTPDSVKEISIPVCVSVGSEDQMVTQHESREIAQSMPQGEFKVLEGVPHAIEKVPGEVLAQLINAYGAKAPRVLG